MLAKTTCLSLFLLTLALLSPAGVINQYGGTYSNWPTQWTTVLSLNDGDNGLTRDWLDFVGDATDPCGYYAEDENYAYFRMRVDAGTISASTYTDTLLIAVDRIGYGTVGHPDYFFAWDTNGGGGTHGMELGVVDQIGANWAATRMADVDGNSGQKIAPPDFRTTGGDGYLRTSDGQSTTNFGTTTYVDWAISWSYLAAQTTLARYQDWRIQFASIDNATDHNPLRYDVAANHNPTDNGLTFSDTITLGSQVPEPSSMLLLGVGLGGLWLRRRKPQP